MGANLIKELREKTGVGILDCKKALEANDFKIEDAIKWLREKGIGDMAKRAHKIATEGLADIIIDNNKAVILEVNCETDFVAKNIEFQKLIKQILETIIKNNVQTIEEAQKLTTNEGTIEELLIAKTSKIGEKLSFRRFELVTKEDKEVFGAYIHLGGKIASLVVIEGVTKDIAYDVAMHIAAMNPIYIKRNDVPVEEIEKETNILREQAINEGKPEEIANKMVKGRINKYYKDICLEEQMFIKDDSLTVGNFVKNNGGVIKKMCRFEVGEGLEKKVEDFACEVREQLK